MTSTSGTTVLALVSQRSLIRAGLRSVAEDVGAAQVIEATSLAELGPALLRVGRQGPDLLIVESRYEPAELERLVAEARGRYREARIVLMSNALDFESMGRCFAAGLDGYLLEDIGRHSLADSLHLVQLGEKVFPSHLATIMQDRLRQLSDPQPCASKLESGRLSAREAEVLRLLTVGEPNKLIARRLNISEATVKVHVKSILRKTRARNRTEAALWAITPATPAPAAPAH